MNDFDKTNRVIVVGIIQPENGSGRIHVQDYIYCENGVAPTLTARDWRSPRTILIGDYVWNS